MNDFFAGVGAGPIPFDAPGSGSLVAYSLETFQTPLLDMTQSISGIELVPARPGYLPYPGTSRWIIEAFAGTQVTPAVIQAGSDPAHVNFLSQQSAPPNASVNVATPPSLGTSVAAAADGTQRAQNASVFFDVVSGAQGTGGFVLKAKLCVIVLWFGVG